MGVNHFPVSLQAHSLPPRAPRINVCTKSCVRSAAKGTGTKPRARMPALFNCKSEYTAESAGRYGGQSTQWALWATVASPAGIAGNGLIARYQDPKLSLTGSFPKSGNTTSPREPCVRALCRSPTPPGRSPADLTYCDVCQELQCARCACLEICHESFSKFLILFSSSFSPQTAFYSFRFPDYIALTAPWILLTALSLLIP